LAVEFKRAKWFKKFMHHKRWKFISGGRGSGKTTHIAARLVEIAHQNRVNILVCREIEKSIDDSVYLAVKEAIKRVGLLGAFHYTQHNIISKITGAKFSFIGLSKNPDKVLSIENLCFVWVEQAEKVTAKSIEFLTPTLRAKNAEIWFSWNPRFPSDPIQVYYESLKGAEGITYEHVTYKDNPFFPDGLEEERLMCFERLPEIYEHVWGGGYCEDGLGTIVLPYQELKECIGLDERLNLGMEVPRWAYGGVDVADGGPDKPAFAIRRSAKLIMADELPLAKNAIHIAEHVVPLFNHQKIARCFYDGTGVGASLKTEFLHAEKDGRLKFETEPFLFGGKVKAPDRKISKGVTNSDYFANLSAQAYWNLRVRLKRSLRLIGGEKINPEYCLILPRGIKEKTLRQLGQVMYERKREMKISIDKKAGGSSPDIADAVVMSYAEDIRTGVNLDV
jgi:phage terminase large subunit